MLVVLYHKLKSNAYPIIGMNESMYTVQVTTMHMSFTFLIDLRNYFTLTLLFSVNKL